MATVNINPGTDVQMTVTNLNNLADSATAGWQSAMVDNTSTKAVDYQVNVKVDLANTAAAAPSALYVYVVPWLYDGSAWTPGADGGTATAPSGSEGTYTIAATNNLILAKVLNYVATDSVIYGFFNLQNLFPTMPDGWSLVIINDTGSAIAASGNVVQYKPITYTVA
jgi:hypothetical protein